MISPSEFEKLFDSFLLYDIEIVHENKLVKKGKLKMVMMKNNVIKFYVSTGATIKIIELYYPFNLKISDTEIILDYHIDKLVKNNNQLKRLIDNYNSEERSPYFDSEVIIRVIK